MVSLLTHHFLVHIEVGLPDHVNRKLDDAGQPTGISLIFTVAAIGSCMLMLPTSISLRSAVIAVIFVLCQAAIIVLLAKESRSEDENLGSIIELLEKISIR